MAKKKQTTKRTSKKRTTKKTPAKRTITTAKPQATRKPRTSTKKKVAASKQPSSSMSILDAAIHVLKQSGTPMRCRAMIDKMLAGGHWSTNGKTPHATLYSAILREIQVKGNDSRFKKVERGLFTLTSKS